MASQLAVQDWPTTRPIVDSPFDIAEPGEIHAYNMHVGPQLGGQKRLPVLMNPISALPIVDISFWNGCLDATLPVLDFISADVCT